MDVPTPHDDEPTAEVNGARPQRKLGELLIADGSASSGQVKKALKRQRLTRRPLGEILVTLGVSSERITSMLSSQTGVAPINLDSVVAEPEAVDSVKTDVAEIKERAHR